MTYQYDKTSWNLYCAWCPYYIIVNGRGMRGDDMGSGVEAANLMDEHVNYAHGHTWKEYLKEPHETRFNVR